MIVAQSPWGGCATSIHTQYANVDAKMACKGVYLE